MKMDSGFGSLWKWKRELYRSSGLLGHWSVVRHFLSSSNGIQLLTETFRIAEGGSIAAPCALRSCRFHVTERIPALPQAEFLASPQPSMYSRAKEETCTA
jgi:hypothetical protein